MTRARLLESIPPPDYLAEFEACTTQTRPRANGDLEFETYYGLTKQAAWTLLDACVNPLDWFQMEQKFNHSPVLTTVSEDR